MDNRAKIPENLISGLMKGKLSGVLQNVKTNSKLQLCFRGNSTPPKIIVYYNNHIVWRICYSKGKNRNGFKVEVSVNHAKGEKKRELLNKLRDDFGFNIPNAAVLTSDEEMAKIKYPYRYITETVCLPANFFTDLSDLMTGVMDLYFSKNNQKNKYIEKQRQHELFSALTNAQDGYYVYDLEFSQKYDSVSSRLAEGEQNHPDMLGIRYKNGTPKALVLIEVKSTEAACKGKCGLIKHINGMLNYLNSHHMPDREQEACDIIKLYKELGIRNTPKSIPVPKDLKNHEIAVVLTDKAITYYETEFIKKGKNFNNNNTKIFKWEKGKLDEF